MLSGLQSILPLFLMMGLGYLARCTVFDIKWLPGLNLFVFYFAVPALLFDAASKMSLNTLINGSALVAFILGAMITVGIGVLAWNRLFGKPVWAEQILLGLNGTFANFAYMGIPLTLGLLGETAQPVVVMIILLGNLLLVGGAQLLLEFGHAKGIGFRQVLAVMDRSVLRNPVFLATGFGLLFAAFQLEKPVSLQALLDMLAPAAIPVALFCIGASLQFSQLQMNPGQLALLVTLKLFLHPAITWGCLTLLDVGDPVWVASMVLLTALPTGALAHVIALKYQTLENETSQVVVVSTLCSLFSISAWVALVGA